MVEINPIASQIVLNFICPHCGKETTTEPIRIPNPNWEGDNYSDSLNEDFEEYYCEHCGEEIDIHIGNSICGGFADIDGVDEIGCEELFDDDEYIEEQIEEFIKAAPSQYYGNFTQAITNIRLILASFSSNILLDKQLLPLLYAHVITLMETYLGDTLKKFVLSDKKYKRAFVETYFDYKKEKFVLNNFFVVMENIDKNIAKTLNELLYHNLAKIKCIYKATLNVDLGDISVLAKAVEIRHDIIHRNCKHTDNTSFEITETQLDNLIKCVDTFITYIEEQIKLL